MTTENLNEMDENLVAKAVYPSMIFIEATPRVDSISLLESTSIAHSLKTRDVQCSVNAKANSFKPYSLLILSLSKVLLIVHLCDCLTIHGHSMPSLFRSGQQHPKNIYFSLNVRYTFYRTTY